MNTMPPSHAAVPAQKQFPGELEGWRLALLCCLLPMGRCFLGARLAPGVFGVAARG